MLFSLHLPQGLSYLCVSHPSRFVFGFRFWIVLLCVCDSVVVFGTGSFNKRRNKTHTLCVRCGHSNFHLQKSRCSAYAYPAACKRTCMPPPFSLCCINLCKYIYIYIYIYLFGECISVTHLCFWVCFYFKF